jgi:hypothetical protein
MASASIAEFHRIRIETVAHFERRRCSCGNGGPVTRSTWRESSRDHDRAGCRNCPTRNLGSAAIAMITGSSTSSSMRGLFGREIGEFLAI